MHREPGGIWRIDYQLPPGETPEQALAPESLRQRIDAQLALVGAAGLPWELDWSSVYSTRAMTLPDYVVGRVCYAGDAAHLLPIFGVRGANTGWQDGQGLAWRLALAAKGLAGPGLLASYSQERVAAAREIILEAGKSTRFMTPPSVGFRLLRDAVLSLSLSEDFVRPLFHWRTSRPHEYHDSELNSRQDDNLLFSAGPAAGAAMRNVRLGADGYLMDSAFAGFQLMYFGAGAELPGDVLASVSAWRARGVPIQIIAVNRGESESGIDKPLSATDDKSRLRNDFTASPVPGEIAAQREPANAREIADPAGRVWSTYGVSRSGAAYLIRPDQHVCARWQTLQGDRLDAAMRQVLAMGGEQGLPGFKSAVGVEKSSPDATPAAVQKAASPTQSATDAKRALTLPGLEQVYDVLANALSQTPQRERFLVKLALLLAQECGDAGHVGAAIEAAARDLSRAAD
jgi:3-(3-hydroxy-phenyl)propionate hydroxylase